MLVQSSYVDIIHINKTSDHPQDDCRVIYLSINIVEMYFLFVGRICDNKSTGKSEIRDIQTSLKF